MVDRQPDEPSDSLLNMEEELERRLELEGYQMGQEQGEKAGREEGYSQGLIEGAKRGSEVGQYAGLAMTWIQLLKLKEVDQETNKQSLRILSKLNEVMELVENFPKQNETFCEDKLNLLRVKFKQTTSMLNIKI